MKYWLSDIQLKGEQVELQLMMPEHANSLADAAADGELWNLWYTGVPSKDTAADYIDVALQQKQAGQSLPFVVFDKRQNQIVGSTRFCNADPVNRHVEIGYTWYSKSVQRTAVNSECKYLMLNHAFETLSSIAVEFRTHWHNQASRNAILRLGAKQDGVLRNHRIENGVYRDTVCFSIIESEWPAVRQSLLSRLSG